MVGGDLLYMAGFRRSAVFFLHGDVPVADFALRSTRIRFDFLIFSSLAD